MAMISSSIGLLLWLEIPPDNMQERNVQQAGKCFTKTPKVIVSVWRSHNSAQHYLIRGFELQSALYPCENRAGVIPCRQSCPLYQNLKNCK
jgi:hypothetical protein